MDRVRGKNPLGFIAVATLITLPFDFYWYLVERYLILFGILVIICKAMFLFLYVRKSRFAWHVGIILTASITTVSLLLIAFGVETSRPHHSRHPLVELTVVFILLVYQWLIRDRYFRYVEQKI
jgi:hypothetical protein